MFRNLQIRSKLLAIVVVPLLALVAFAGVQVVSSVRSRVEADRLNRATQFASSLTALVDSLQRERAISRGYVASGKRANFGTMIADRVLVNTALQSFQRNLRALRSRGFSAQFSRDLGAANASLRVDPPPQRPRGPARPLPPAARAGGPARDVRRRSGTAGRTSGGGPCPPRIRATARFGHGYGPASGSQPRRSCRATRRARRAGGSWSRVGNAPGATPGKVRAASLGQGGERVQDLADRDLQQAGVR
ncbi:MAG TPA: nitrate- and nitrite sensing domain-containing protein, partial [Actinomycetes bacterium]|nr:nitrate- and nitrite sensing domain-containing protein [Actinomycetes bacterium]